MKVTSAVSRAASLLSRDLHVRAVVVPTRSGGTARIVSSERPAAPVIAVASDERVCRSLALCWGVTPELATEEASATRRYACALMPKPIRGAGDPILMV